LIPVKSLLPSGSYDAFMNRKTAYEYAGPPELLPKIDGALRRVVDPEVALNIVDVGLIHAVEATADRVSVRMTMTSAACPVADVIVDDVEFELGNDLPEGTQVDVELVWEPPWTPERMSDKARLFMGW
jgi:metal-sulfur cluster biosynthetic enzyme